MSNNVQLIDPLFSNIPTFGSGDERKTYFPNEVPSYEDMHIYAELVAERRGRTVLETNTKGLKANLVRTGLEDDVKVNFLGFNQDVDSPDNGHFTTRYYDDMDSDGSQHDSFGITKIKTLINSSYIPQVDIEFTDVRGLSFFNRDNSPYRILFDFPPPIFYLTIKGYYGKALQYQLHLVKYTTDFDSTTGNYVINAKFIAITYAPLTDILYKYVLNFGLIDKEAEDGRKAISVDLDNTRPRTTFELIQKSKILFDSIKDEISNNQDSESYDRAISQQIKIDEAIAYLRTYRTTLPKINDEYVPVLFTFNTEDGDDFAETSILNNLAEYDTIIQNEQTEGIPNNISNKLYVGYIKLVTITDKEGNDLTSRDAISSIDQEIALTEFKKNLRTKTNKLLGGETFIVPEDISEPKELKSKEYFGEINNILPQEFTIGLTTEDNNYISVTYFGINLTNYYLKLYKRKFEVQREKNIAASNVNEQINELILDKLGMLPTIYNIFEILLNDVDHFFSVMRKTVTSAEVHHNQKYKEKILSGAGNSIENINDKIYAFPLVLKQEPYCGGHKKVRTSPRNISDRLPEPFPEMTLLEKFIDSFRYYTDIVTLLNMRTEIGELGAVKWLPCNPVDTNLVTTNPSSPYIGVGNELTSPISASDQNSLNQILQTFLERFYIISQNTIRYNFYNPSLRNIDPLRTIYDDSEAINIVSAIFEKTLGDFLIEQFRKFRNVNTFYNYLEQNKDDIFKNLFSFTGKTEAFSISNSEPLYVNPQKNGGDNQYTGFKIFDGDIGLRSQENYERSRRESKEDKKYDNPIDEFVNSANYNNVWSSLGYTQQHRITDSNLIYFKDGDTLNSDFDLKTKYVVENYNNEKNNFGRYFKTYYNSKTDKKQVFLQQSEKRNRNVDYDFVFNKALDGHVSFSEITGYPDPKLVSNKDAITDVPLIWAHSLSDFGNYVVNCNKYGNGDINNAENRFIRSIMYLSSFGWALSPFSIYPYAINPLIYSLPSVNEIPTFLLSYMGSLIDIEGSQNYSNLVDFINNGRPTVNINNVIIETEIIRSGGFLIFADILNVNNQLSSRDKKTLRLAYQDFMENDFETIDSEIRKIYEDVLAESVVDAFDNFNNNIEKQIQQRTIEFNKRLNNTNNVFRLLMKKRNFINFNDITFYQPISESTTLTKYYPSTTPPLLNVDEYISLEEINSENQYSALKTTNDEFFTTFFDRLVIELEKRVETLEKREVEFTRDVDDNDIFTQTYYSFKNINDKWLAGLNKNTQGYPFNTPRSDNRPAKLIDQFVFVDRAMNPIGDTIINFEPLITLEKDTKVSIFSIINQILSINGFEFFPLQNFMSFENNQWEKSFEMDNGPIEKQFPTFVCMYIGGSSSYPTGLGRGENREFEDDGIVDLNSLDIPDFNSSECEPNTQDDNQINNNSNFEYSQVKAFKVKFGDQNQSMFKDIQIDSKEYPETNESLQILGQIAGDNTTQAPTPKGQNLYNLYENRSYKATVSGFGNVMIQPTQYFQLENVPLFNGAYVILEVEHDITPNKMETRFSGTKLLKYPIPRVIEPATIFGFKTGDNNITFDGAVEGVGTNSNPTETQYNEMYFLKV